VNRALPLLFVLFLFLPLSVRAEEADEDDLQYLTLRAGLGVGARYMIPTTTDDRDERRDNMGQLDGYIRSAYFALRSDMANRTFAWINLGLRQSEGADISDRDDPNDDRLVLTLSSAGLRAVPATWFGLEAGVVRSPWDRVSSKAWGETHVSYAPARRYGFVPESDLGLSAFGEVPLPVVPFAYGVSVTNGESDQRREDERYKAVEGQVSFRPLRWCRPLRRIGASLGYGYRLIDDPPGDSRRDNHFFGFLMSHRGGLVRLGVEVDLLLRRYESDVAPYPAGLLGTYGLLAVTPNCWVFVRTDFLDSDLRNESNRESTAGSLRSDRQLRSDEDGRLYARSGVDLSVHGPFNLVPFVEAVFYQEPGPGGGVIAPTVTMNLLAYLQF